MQQKHVSVLRAGLTCGIILVIGELAFGAAIYYLRPLLVDYLNGSDLASVAPLASVWVAFLFLVLAIYFACGMIAAKWLAPLPLKSREIAVLGAMAGAIAEALRSIVAILINFALSLYMPLATADTFKVALENAGLRLICGMPLFILVAAVVAGVSAYIFSMIFFRPEIEPKQ